MPADVLCTKVGDGLAPMNERAKAAFAKLKQGQVYRVKVVQVRNGRFLRLYWKLIDTVWKNSESVAYPDLDDFHNAIKIMTGHRRRLSLANDIRDEETGELVYKAGTVFFVPKSIAFDSMTQESFDRFFDRVADLITVYFWPTVTVDWLRAEIAKMLRLEDDRKPE